MLCLIRFGIKLKKKAHLVAHDVSAMPGSGGQSAYLGGVRIVVMSMRLAMLRVVVSGQRPKLQSGVPSCV